MPKPRKPSSGELDAFAAKRMSCTCGCPHWNIVAIVPLQGDENGLTCQACDTTSGGAFATCGNVGCGNAVCLACLVNRAEELHEMATIEIASRMRAAKEGSNGYRN